MKKKVFAIKNTLLSEILIFIINKLFKLLLYFYPMLILEIKQEIY